MMRGPEPFAAFMARALHDPDNGYYTRHIRTVGARGDFSTSATLSSLLGQAAAAWIRGELRAQPSIRHIIEIGPGDGSLHDAVRRELGWWRRRRFQSHLVETSPVLRQRQQERLGAKAVWHESLAEALDACGGSAFIYHNEVLDAFPATLLEWRHGAWHEVWVEFDANQRPHESLKPSPPELELNRDIQAWRPREGQRIEILTSVKAWMEDWAPHWKSGAMLTIDYGDVFPALYHRRPAGTLRGYLLQQRLTGSAIYENIGRQDITADVNFSDYRAWASALGWTETFYGTQARFVMDHVRLRKRSAADAFLLSPDGAGEAFKCVVHRRLRR
jgi:SAM-dependent MidA family methyltransferase